LSTLEAKVLAVDRFLDEMRHIATRTYRFRRASQGQPACVLSAAFILGTAKGGNMAWVSPSCFSFSAPRLAVPAHGETSTEENLPLGRSHYGADKSAAHAQETLPNGESPARVTSGAPSASDRMLIVSCVDSCIRALAGNLSANMESSMTRACQGSLYSLGRRLAHSIATQTFPGDDK